MKAIFYSKEFIKVYKRSIKGNKNLEKRLHERVALFLRNQNDPLLRNHELQGSMKDYRSFSVTGDYRIIYREYSEYFHFLKLGTHNQVY
jgi:addiction module RelE/StbE family toxin